MPEIAYPRFLILESCAGWVAPLHVEPLQDRLQFTVELWRDNVPHCRITRFGMAPQSDSVLAELTAMAEGWVAEYCDRPHSGDTTLAELF